MFYLIQGRDVALDHTGMRRLTDELENGSDRSAVISAAACVEDQLTEVFKALLKKDEGVFQQLFRAGGALGNFSSKIALGYLLGLYDLSMKKELETIKSIRNIFAHQQRAQDFGFGRCRDLANNLCVSEKLEFYMPNLVAPLVVAELKTGDEVWLAIGLRDAFGSRCDGPTSILPELVQGQTHTPREKYLRSCRFYVAYLFVAIFMNLGERFHSGFVFPKNAFRLSDRTPSPLTEGYELANSALDSSDLYATARRS